MKKILLLTTTILLSSAGVYAACNPNLPACQCAYPEMKDGIIGCSESYCDDKKCMPDGSCCPEANYCESTEKYKECCAENQTCDTTKGCVEGKNIEVNCASGQGTILKTTSGTYCLFDAEFSWSEAKEFCERNGMTMPTLEEICPTMDKSQNENVGAMYVVCPEVQDWPGTVVWLADTAKTYATSCTGEYISLTIGSSGVFCSDPAIIPNSAICH